MQPGAQFSYSGGGFTLLQLIIEEVTGETFSAYMQREVLDPLGISHSSFEWRADLRPATAVAYSEWGSPLPNYLFTEQAAGLYTTAPDLARFVAAEMPGPHGEPAGRGVLSPDTLSLMFNPVILPWGLGQSISTLPDGSKLIQHGGSNSGWKAFIVANPKWGVGFVILTNSDNGENLFEKVLKEEILPLLIMEKILRILIPVLILAFLIVAIFFIKSLASHRQLWQKKHEIQGAP